MTELSKRILTLVFLGLAGCVSSPPTGSNVAPDIVRDQFPEAEAAVRAAILKINDHVSRSDWDGLRSDHLDSPKFTKFGPRVLPRCNFEETIADEIAGLSRTGNLSVDFRNLKVDVFGDVAVATSYPLFSATGPSGEPVVREARMTLVYVKTPDGWKITHEHSSPNTK